MKKSSKVCVILNISCALCIVLVAAAAITVYLMIAHKPDVGHCTRQQAVIAKECAKKDDEIGAAALKLNHTSQLLLHPEKYETLLELCKSTMHCAREIKCKEIRNVLDDLRICGFFAYFSEEFGECAKKLYAKKDDVDCLGNIFNAKQRTSEETCHEWKSIPQCMKTSIKEYCDDKLGVLQFKWLDKPRLADMLYCKENSTKIVDRKNEIVKAN